MIKVVWNISLSFFTFFSSNHEPKTHSKHQTNDVFFARVEFAKDDVSVFVSGKPLSAFFSLILHPRHQMNPLNSPMPGSANMSSPIFATNAVKKMNALRLLEPVSPPSPDDACVASR